MVVLNLQERAEPVDPPRWQFRTPMMFVNVGQVGSWCVPATLGSAKDKEKSKPECCIDQCWQQGHHQGRGRGATFTSETARDLARGGGSIASGRADIRVIIWVLLRWNQPCYSSISIAGLPNAKCWGDSRTTDILDGCLVPGAWFLSTPGGTELGRRHNSKKNCGTGTGPEQREQKKKSLIH